MPTMIFRSTRGLEDKALVDNEEHDRVMDVLRLFSYGNTQNNLLFVATMTGPFVVVNLKEFFSVKIYD